MKEIKNHIKELAKRSPAEELNKRKIKAFEVRNLYVDNEDNIESTNKVLEKVKEFECAFAYAYHDKDFYTEKTFNSQYELIGNVGEKKKPHYHLYVVLNSPKTISDIALHLGVTNNQIQSFKEKHFRNKILYLTHICYSPSEKYIYSPLIIETNVRDYVNFIYETFEPVKDMYQVVLETLDNNKGYITKRNIFELISKNECLQSYEKHYKLIMDIIEEHNDDYREVYKCRKMHELERENAEAKQIVKERKILDACGFVHDVDNGELIYKTKVKEKNKK